MKTAFNRLAALALMTGMILAAAKVQAGPSIVSLSETNLASSSNSPFHLNTDRYKEAYQSISGYLGSNSDLAPNSILIADNHGHLLHGVVSDWSYYTYGTHKGVELYVFNPEDGSQFLTVEVFLPKEQQRNMDKRESYLSSFQQIVSLLSGPSKYRLDLVFQDDVELSWGKGYEFKLDEEGVELSFTIANAARPRAKSHEMVKETVKSVPTTVPTVKPTAAVTVQVTVSQTMTTTPTAKKSKKKKKSSKSSDDAASAPTAVPTIASSDNNQ